MANGPFSFPLHANDWLSSKKITLMTPAEEGAYIRLLCHAWADPDCALPDDDAQLAVLSRLGPDWKGGSCLVRRCFVNHPTKVGLLVNPRLCEERRKVEKWIEKSRKGGLHSGKSRHSISKGGSLMVPTKDQPKANTPKTNPKDERKERSGGVVHTVDNGEKETPQDRTDRSPGFTGTGAGLIVKALQDRLTGGR